MLTLNFKDIQGSAGLNVAHLDYKITYFIELALDYIFGIAGLILLVNLISAGYQIMFSQGDPKAMGVAKSKITTSLVGILILFASFWLVRILGQFLGISVFSDIFK